jgi:hypothetical protein
MKKIKITAHPDILQILQRFCAACLANPGHNPKTGHCEYYTLQEWALRNIYQIHPPTTRPVNFALRRSEAAALYSFLTNLGLSDHEQHFERNNLLGSIGKQMPSIIPSPV